MNLCRLFITKRKTILPHSKSKIPVEANLPALNTLFSQTKKSKTIIKQLNKPGRRFSVTSSSHQEVFFFSSERKKKCVIIRYKKRLYY